MHENRAIEAPELNNYHVNKKIIKYMQNELLQTQFSSSILKAKQKSQVAWMPIMFLDF